MYRRKNIMKRTIFRIIFAQGFNQIYDKILYQRCAQGEGL